MGIFRKLNESAWIYALLLPLLRVLYNCSFAKHFEEGFIIQSYNS